MKPSMAAQLAGRYQPSKSQGYLPNRKYQLEFLKGTFVYSEKILLFLGIGNSHTTLHESREDQYTIFSSFQVGL